MRKLLLIVIVMFGCNGDDEDNDGAVHDAPSISETSQSLSACVNNNGLALKCITGNGADQCLGSGPEGTCNCPEATSTELAYCANRNNCSRPEYSTYCIGAPCPFGNAHFTHWCVSGPMP